MNCNGAYSIFKWKIDRKRKIGAHESRCERDSDRDNIVLAAIPVLLKKRTMTTLIGQKTLNIISTKFNSKNTLTFLIYFPELMPGNLVACILFFSTLVTKVTKMN